MDNDKMMEMIERIAHEVVKTEYDETISALRYVLTEQAGVSLKSIEKTVDKVPTILDEFIETRGDESNIDSMRASMKVLDLLFIGLLFHTHVRTFIGLPGEGGDE